MLMIGTCVIILDMSIQTQKKPLLLLTHPHVYLCMYMYMCVSSMYVTAAAGPDHERVLLSWILSTHVITLCIEPTSRK